MKWPTYHNMKCPLAEKNNCDSTKCLHAETHDKNDFCCSEQCLAFVGDVSCVEVE